MPEKQREPKKYAFAHLDRRSNAEIAAGAAAPAQPVPPSAEALLNWRPYLSDRADGVKGHFCIARLGKYHGLDTTEFWNPSGWSAFGYLFTDQKLAEAIMDLLNTARASSPAVAQQKQEREASLAKISETAERVRSQPEIYGNNRISAPAVAGRTQGGEPIEKFLRIARAYVAEGIPEFDSAFIEAEQALLETRAADYGRGYAEGKLAERAGLRESASPKREVRELCDIHRASVSGCHECQKVDGESAREVRSELVDNSLILKALATLQVISPVGSTDYEAAKSLLAKVSSLRSASTEAPAAKGQ